jgi:hypothetical protein
MLYDTSMQKGLALILVVLACLPATAQTSTGTIVGRVVDASGAVVPGAKIRIVNNGTKIARSVITESDGAYTALLLPPGSYSMEVSAQGFKKVEQAGIELNVQQQARVDITLQVGALTESVSVKADAAVVEASSSSVGKVVDNKRILELPLNTRNVYSLVSLTPGVTGSVGNQYNAVSYSVNGARTGTFATLVDGAPADFPTVNGGTGTSVFPSIDAVEEFKVQAQNYNAEFGRSMTSVLNLVYKSGGNQFHGSAYEFLRNSVLDANNFFNNSRGVPLSSFKRNQFGGTVSGPIKRNKTFFLGAFEALRQRQFRDTLTTVPTDAQRGGDFSQTRANATQLITLYDPATTRPNPTGSGFVRDVFPGNFIPSPRFDPVARNVLKYYPKANLPGDPGTLRNNFYNSGAAAVETNNGDVRIDHNISDTQRLNGRFSYRKSFDGPPQLFPGDLGIAEGRFNQSDFGRNAVIEYVKTISPTSVLNARMSFARSRFLYDNQGLGFAPSNLGLPKALDAAVDRYMFPAFGVSGQVSLGGNDHRQSGFNNYGSAVSYSKILSRHSLKAGWDGRMIRDNIWEARAAGAFNFNAAFTQGPNPAAASATAGYGLASFLLGLGSSGNFYQNWKNVASQSFYHAFYIQDDWRVTNKLTLNLGVRYDFDTPRTERYNRMSWFDPAIASPLSNVVPNLKGGLRFVGVDGNDRTQYNGDFNNIAPRLGFAYQVNAKTSVRGGFGQLFGASTMAAQGTVGPYGFRVETPWVATLDNGITPFNTLSNPFPAGFPPVPGASSGALTAVGGLLQAPLATTNTPYTLQYNFTIQRELPGAVLLEAAYVGNRGRQLSRGGEGGYTLNQVNPQYLSLGAKLTELVDNPFYGTAGASGVLAPAKITRAQLLRPFPQFDAIQPLFYQGATSDYNSLQVTFRKRYAQGMVFEGNYTWAKAMDEGTSNQDSYNTRASRGVSSVDVPHRFVFSSVYELPIGRGRHFGNRMSRMTDLLIGGWQVNGIVVAQTGSAFGISGRNTSNLFTEAFRVNGNGKDPVISGDAHDRLNRWFDTSVFSQPAPYTLGNLPPLISRLRNHNIRNLDFSLFKQFSLTEKVRLQFRAEAFNAFNRVRFSGPNTDVNGGANFGRVTAQSNDPRQLQFGLKLMF